MGHPVTAKFQQILLLSSRFVWTEKIRSKGNPELEEKLTKFLKKVDISICAVQMENLLI